MTQNLALNLSTDVALTPDNSDVSKDWTPSYSTTTALALGEIADSIGAETSFTVREYVINTPNAGVNLCGNWVSVLSDCDRWYGNSTHVGENTGYTDDYADTNVTGADITAVDQTNKKYDAHYLLGNYYTWYAATAGTGRTVEGYTATSSICPKGWHLPTENNTSTGTYTNLLSIYGIPSNDPNGAIKVGAAPLYLHRAGYVFAYSWSTGITNIGSTAYYWSRSMPDESWGMTTLAHNLHLYNGRTMIDREQSEYAMSVRCVADGQKELNDLTYMQEMTNDVCRATRTPTAEEISTVPTKQLIDSRDSKTYWVAKLADGHCWMTQNLRLELSTDTALTPKDTDLNIDWTPGISTSSNYKTDNFSHADPQSSSTGDYAIRRPNRAFKTMCYNAAIISDCQVGENGLVLVGSDLGYNDTYVAAGGGDTQSEVDTNTVAVDIENLSYDSHYLLGNYYSYGAVGATRAGTTDGDVINESICPKGWHLPALNESTSVSFFGLMGAYDITETKEAWDRLGSAPTYLFRAGTVDPASGLSDVSSTASYWTENNGRALVLQIQATGNLRDWSGNYYRYNGMSVRCAL